MSERTIRMCARDQMLRGGVVIGIIGPIHVPGHSAVVAALRQIAGYGPRTRVGLKFGRGGRRWAYDEDELDGWCEELVVSIPPASAETINGVATRQQSLVDDRHPLRIVLAGDYVIQLNDHSLGDGGMFLDRLAAIIQLASGESGDHSWLTERSVRFPLITAAWETFSHKKIRAALIAARRAEREIPSEEGSRERIPWDPQLAIATASTSVATLKELQNWIKQTDRTVTVPVALMVALRGALVSTGIAVQRDSTMIYDARRYLPAHGGAVIGNFVTGLSVRVADPTDPVQVAAAVRVHLESARPLAAMLVGTSRYQLLRGSVPELRAVPVRPRAHIVLNSMGIFRPLQRLRWKASPENRRCAFLMRPASGEHITFAIVIVEGVIHLSASFHSNVFDATAVQKALRRLAEDPVAFLDSDAKARITWAPSDGGPTLGV